MDWASNVTPQLLAARPPESKTIEVVSAIVPVLRDDGAVGELHQAYKVALAAEDRKVEFLYVLDRRSEKALAALRALKSQGEALSLIVLSSFDSEGAALRSAFQRAGGSTVLILSGSRQIDPQDLPKVLAGLADSDMAVAKRTTRSSSWCEALQARLFERLVRILFGCTIADPVCRVRACRRHVLEQLAGYSVQQHFLPLLAADCGFRVAEIEVRRGEPTEYESSFQRFSVLSRLRLGFEAISLFIVLKFIFKPLRLFGAVGVPILLVGLTYTGILGISRLVFGAPLADRPALILGVLLIVLGIQVIALGLIAEIIIFASGKRIRDYMIEKIL